MTVAISTDAAQSGWLKIDIVGNAVAAGIVGSVANPEGVDVYIIDGYLHIETASTAASTFNVGIGASAVADYSNLLSAMPMNGAADSFWGVITRVATETAATTPGGQVWLAANFLTVTSAAQASTGLTASLYLQYIRMD